MTDLVNGSQFSGAQSLRDCFSRSCSQKLYPAHPDQSLTLLSSLIFLFVKRYGHIYFSGLEELNEIIHKKLSKSTSVITKH